MKCTGCGLPLSPQRTHCPRCGKAAGDPEKKGNAQAETPQYAFPSLQGNPNIPLGMEAFQAQPAGIAPQQVYNEMPGQIFHSAGTEQFPGQPNQMVLPDQGQTLQANPAQKSDWQAFPQANPGNVSPEDARAGEFRPFPQKPGPTRSQRTVQPGFTVAGLCILSGGIILMLVYIISLNLPALTTGNTSATIAANTPTSQSLSPSSQATATPVVPTVTPTPSLPGKMYIDNAQMGSSLVLNTAQLSQVTTTFTVNQKIFVTFILHPLNTGGTVCLNWYVNQKQFSQFSFAVGAGLQHAYSFAFANSAGPGSVSISWSNSNDCTNKILAQVVTFTVTP